MLQSWLTLIPARQGALPALVAAAGAFAGVLLVIFGGRCNRYLLTLTAVAVGTALGSALPRWCGWDVDNMGPAVGGSVLIGASGFALHRLWTGVGVGTIAALWASLGAWALLAKDVAWSWPVAAPLTPLPVYLQTVYHALPPAFAHWLPIVSGVAMLSGGGMAVVWPRAGVTALYAGLGVTLVVGLGLWALEFARPAWVGYLPARSVAQVGALALLTTVASVTQWKMTYGKSAASSRGGSGGRGSNGIKGGGSRAPGLEHA